MSSRPIGIFDSGVGGLTVLTKIREILPNESIIYVGDTANAPYGGKTPKTLLNHGRDIINFLRSHDVKAITLACGTTSSTVYEELTGEYPDLPLIDVIRPGVKACVEHIIQHSNTRFGLIATAATIKSGLFKQLLLSECPNAHFLEQACPMFAPMVEAGVTNGPTATWAAKTYLEKWQGKIDTLILGCTHYPLLTQALTSVLGDVKCINLASHAASELKNQLTSTDILNDSDASITYKYYVSGDTAAFNKTSRFLLGYDPNAEQLNLIPSHK